MSMIRLNHLSYRYGRTAPALDGLDLSLESGQVVGLLGENGAGKSTLLKILAALIGNYQGEVFIDGKVPGLETKGLLSYLPENSALDEELNARQLIRYFRGLFTDFRPEEAERLLNAMGIEPEMKLTQMSKGMREKVQISLCLARSAKVYLLDEPGSGLDLVSQDEIFYCLLEKIRADSLIIISTHRLSDFEAIFDRVLLLEEGRLTENRSLDELRESYGLGLEAFFRGRVCAARSEAGKAAYRYKEDERYV